MITFGFAINHTVAFKICNNLITALNEIFSKSQIEYPYFILYTLYYYDY